MEALVEGGLGLGIGSLESLLGTGGDLEAARAALLAAAVAGQDGSVRRAPTLPMSFTDMSLPYEHFAANNSILSGLGRGQNASELTVGRDAWAGSQQQQIGQQKQSASSSASMGGMPLSTVRMLLQAQALAHGAVGGPAPPSGIRSAASGAGADRDRSSGGDRQGNHERYEHRSGSGVCSDAAGGSPSIEGVPAGGRMGGVGSGSHKLALSKAASGFESAPSLVGIGGNMALGNHGVRSLTSSPARGASGGSGGRPGSSDAFFGACAHGGMPAGGEAGSQVDVLKALLAASSNPLGALGLGGAGAGAGVSPTSGDGFNGALLTSLLQQLSSIGSASSPMGADRATGGNVGAAPAAALQGLGGDKAASADGGIGHSMPTSHVHELLAQRNGKESAGVNGGLDLLTATIKPEVVVAGKDGSGGGFSPQQAAALRQLYQQAGLPGSGGGLSGVVSDGMLGGLHVPGLGTLAANGLQLNQLLAMAASSGRMPWSDGERMLQDDLDALQSAAAAARDHGDGRGGGSQAALASGSSRSGGGAAAGAAAGCGSNSVRSYRHGGNSGGSDSTLVPCANGNISGASNGTAKGPTGLHVIKALVNSGAAGAGMVGLINGASGLADLAGLPGGVATQLMEDLESLGYRGGSAAGNVGGATVGVRRGGPGGSLGSGEGASSGAGRPGEAAAGRNGGIWATASSGKGGRWGMDSVSPVQPTASNGARRPNKRPENGSLATQILKRQRAMQQAAAEAGGGGTAGGGGGGLSAGDPGLLLGNATGLGALGGPPGSPSGGLAGVLGGLPAAAAAAAAAGLPPVSATAALLAAPPTSAGLNAAAIANAVVAVAARNGGGGGTAGGNNQPTFTTAMALAGALGLHGLPGGACLDDLGSGGLTAAAGGPSSAAHLRALMLAGLPASAAALLAASGLPRHGGSMGVGAVDWLLGTRVPRGRRSRRTLSHATPDVLRSILKDLGLGGGRPSTQAAAPDRSYSETDLLNRDDGIANGVSGSGSGRTSGKRISGNGVILGGSLTSSNGPSGTQGPSPPLARRQRVLPSTAAVQVDIAVAAAAAANTGDGLMGLLGSLRWDLLTSKGASGPLTAAAARAMAAALQSVEAERGAQMAAAAVNAAAATAAARGVAPLMVGVANGGGGAAPLGRAAGAAAAASAVGVSGGVASRGGSSGVTATANGGPAAGAAMPVAVGKSRRKGGAPSRAAD